MSNLFQKIKTSVRPAEPSAAPRLTLAAFGKHPGWDDHIPGIGVETEALAYAKQSLYVSGIGKQIDSGAWEKLESGKRLEGFDHTFLWSRPGHILLGELWSSTDGKGRAKYPMVLCVDGEGVASGFLLAKAQPGLELLRTACKTATTADQVAGHCQASQEKLRAHLSPADLGANSAGLTVEARRNFLENREFMPDRLGLMRVLHELGESSYQSRHLRVPLASDAPAEALRLWCEFFKLIVPANTAVLLISHRGADWLDVLIGEPEAQDFFCLQAALKAVPLTTEIPYELPAEMKQRWNELEARFLGQVPPKKIESASAATPTGVGGGVDKSAQPGAVPSGNRKWFVPVLAGAVLLLGVFGYLLSKGSANTKARPTELVTAPAPAPATVVQPVAETVKPVIEPKPKTNPAVVVPPTAPAASAVTPSIQQQYDAVMTEARAALGRQNFSDALLKVGAALALKPGDSAATNLKQDTAARQQDQAAQTLRQQQYAQAMEAGQAAYQNKDFSNAVVQAGIAQTHKTNDLAATKLMEDAKSQLNLLASAAADQQEQYDAAVKSGQAALVLKNFAEAIKQAEAALSKRAGDATAVKLKSDAERAQAELALHAEQDKRYESAMSAGQKAYDAKDYAEAARQADVALTNRATDAAAVKLKSDAVARQAEIVALAERDKNYESAMAAAQSAYSRKDFVEAMKNADVALLNKAGDTDAAGLKTKAAEGKELAEVQAFIESGDLDKARSLCLAHAGNPAFDTLLPKIVENTTGKLDEELEVYLVEFGQRKPANAKSTKAQAVKKMEWSDLGFGPKSQREVFLSEVEKMRAGFKNSGRLDKAHLKDLDDLKQAINDW